MEAERVFVKFVGTDDVIEHIVSLKENKSTTPSAKRKIAFTKADQSKIDDDECEEFCEATSVKLSEGPNGLVANESEMTGSDLFTFKTPKRQSKVFKKDARPNDARRMSKVAFNLRSSPRTPKTSTELPPTPRRSILKKSASAKADDVRTSPANDCVSTPRGRPANDARRKTPRRLKRRDDADDLSSGSDTEGSLISSEDEDEEVPKSKKKSEHATPTSTNKKTPSTQTPSSAKSLGSRRKLNMNVEVTPKIRKKKVLPEGDDESERASACEYFETHHSSKISTSDRTLSRLEVPRLQPSEVVDGLSKVRFPFEEERADLLARHARMFDQWMFSLHLDFNILLHGLGSKINLIELFIECHLFDFSHVIVNGFFPGLTLKSIISAISEVLSGDGSVPVNPIDQLCHVKKLFSGRGDFDFFLVVHNIDGTALRNEKTQQTLSLLCQIPGFHLVASIDHVCSPLLWDLTKSSRFNWLWFEATTYEGYVEETSYENSIMVGRSGSLALGSLLHVMKSLTPNAKEIFLLAVAHQLDGKDEPGFQGFAFPDLYQKCREAFLVNSEQTLRAQLVEFKDHKLIKTKTGADGVEYVLITLDHSILTTFVEQQQS